MYAGQLTVNLTQPQSTVEETLNQELSNSSWPVARSFGDRLECYLIWEDPAHCGLHCFLGKGFELHKCTEIYLSGHKQAGMQCIHSLCSLSVNVIK